MKRAIAGMAQSIQSWSMTGIYTPNIPLSLCSHQNWRQFQGFLGINPEFITRPECRPSLSYKKCRSILWHRRYFPYAVSIAVIQIRIDPLSFGSLKYATS